MDRIYHPMCKCGHGWLVHINRCAIARCPCKSYTEREAA